MRILLLSPAGNPLEVLLKNAGHDVTCDDSRDARTRSATENFDFLISYGYRHILTKEHLAPFAPNRAVNLHISYLPFNRGADPNFWSLVEGTPRGVTIHYLDEGIDTGNIIVQEEVAFDEQTDTLATSYQKLHDAIVALFVEHMPSILGGTCPSLAQSHKGTYHNAKDKDALFEKLAAKHDNVWDTPIREVITQSVGELPPTPS
jgi:methionyl-tRNA formyltransferase